MKYPITLFIIAGLSGCNHVKVPADTAAKLSGRYDVHAYVFNNDTLFSSTGIDRLGLEEFYITVGRKSADSIAVRYHTKKEGDKASVVRYQTAGILQEDDHYQLMYAHYDSIDYESQISGATFSEKARLPGGHLILPENYPMPIPGGQNSEWITIIAEKK